MDRRHNRFPLRRSPSRSSSTPNVCLPSRHAKVRLNRAFLAGGRYCGPRTPVPPWKFSGNLPPDDKLPYQRNEENHIAVSARALAASLWEVQEFPSLRPKVRKLGEYPIDSLGSVDTKQTNVRRGQCLSPASTRKSQRSFLQSPTDFKGGGHRKEQRMFRPETTTSASSLRARTIIQWLTDGKYYKSASSSTSTSTKNGTLDVDGTTSKSDVLKILNQFEEHQSNSMLSVDDLHAELNRTRRQMKELLLKEKARWKEVEIFTKKLVKERFLWQERQQENIRLTLQSFRDQLDAEKKSKRKLQARHRRAVKEFHRVMRNLEKASEDLRREKIARELMEEVCDELAKEIGKDKARVEQLKHESAKARENVEKERKMLQMAEVLREERVQMKLMEAKAELEEKNAALEKSRSELESLLNIEQVDQVKDEDTRCPRLDVHRLPSLSLNLADSFCSKEARVSGRFSTDRHSGVSTSTYKARKIIAFNDDENNDDDNDSSSTGEHDLHSVEVTNRPSIKLRSSQWEYQPYGQQVAEVMERRSSPYRNSNADELRQGKMESFHRVSQTQTSQMERIEKDFYLDPMHDSQRLGHEKGDVAAALSKYPHFPVGKMEVGQSWCKGIEGPIMVEKSTLGSDDGFSTGESADSTGCHDVENATNPSLGLVHQQLNAISSPTHEWNHHWVSLDVRSPLQGKGAVSSELSRVWGENSLKAKLLEAKLEGQRARLSSGTDLS